MASRRSGCVDAFRASNFGLEHANPELFVTSQWQAQCSCCGISYAIYRVIVAIYWLVVLIMSLETRLSWIGLRWLIYLTNWGLLVLTIDVNIQGFTAVYALIQRQKKQNSTCLTKMTVPLKMQWVISNIALGSGFIISVGAIVIFYSVGVKVDFVNVNAHVVNSLYLFCNLFVTATPLRVYHILHTLAFGAVYIVFSVILKYAADISAYESIDWSDPRDAGATAFGCLLGSVVLWLVLYGLYRARLAIFDSGVNIRIAGQPPGEPGAPAP